LITTQKTINDLGGCFVGFDKLAEELGKAAEK